MESQQSPANQAQRVRHSEGWYKQLFVHSSFPTEKSDAVFFGPDTYRFARFIDSTIDTIKLRSPREHEDSGRGRRQRGRRPACGGSGG
jgi:hypothetical protein